MTPQLLKALDFIRDRITLAGHAPTVLEIGTHIGLQSKSGVKRLVDRLVEGGHLLRQPGKARGLDIAGVPDLRLASLDAIRAELARRGETLESLQARAPMVAGRHMRCAADTCGVPVTPGRLFCLTHWRAIPATLQSALLAAHRARDLRQFQALLTQARDIADGCGAAR